MARYNRIFAALDGGSTQDAVIRRTFSIAHDNNAEVLLGHVIDASLFASGGINRKQISEANQKAIEKDLALYINRAKKDPHIPSVEIKVAVGQIAEALEKDLAAPFKPDLVICGARRMSSIKYAFVGSVSSHLVHHMDCDVLVVRPEAIEEIPFEEYEGLEEDSVEEN